MKKKIFSIILLLCMVFSLMPVSAFATEEPVLTEPAAEEVSEPEAEPETEDITEEIAEEPADESLEDPAEEPAEDITDTNLAEEETEEEEVSGEESSEEPELTAEDALALDGAGDVCKIGETAYASIAAALEEEYIDEGEATPTVITLIADDIENVTIASDRFITLDLGGYVLSGDGTASVITNNGTLTITDTNTDNQKHKFTPNDAGLWVRDEESGTKTVTGGCITGGNTNRHGGGIYNKGTLNMTGANIVGNTASSGGGIYVEAGCKIDISDSLISGNTASGDGGGVYISSSYEKGNTLNPSIITASQATLKRVTMTGNKAEYGGAVCMNDWADLLMNGCTVTNNMASNDGGGICKSVEDVGESNQIPTGKFILIDTEITDNTAGAHGGGVYFRNTLTYCFAAGTQITMADGTTTAIENIKVGDTVKTFDHESGKVSSAAVYIAYQGETTEVPFTLTFDNGKTLSIAGCHDLLEKSTLQYVTISEDNAAGFIGKYFYGEDGWHKLVSVTMEETACEYYSIYTAEHQNCFANGFLSVADDTDHLLNIYELDDDLKADNEQLNADIEKYGLATFEYINENYGLSREWYDYTKTKYIFVSIGKGLVTLEDLESIYATTDDANQNTPDYTPVLTSTSPVLEGAGDPTFDDFGEGYLTIGDGTRITGNKAGGRTENVYLTPYNNEKAKDTLSCIEIYGSFSDVSVGVTTFPEPTLDTPVQFTLTSSARKTTYGEDYVRYFFSDSTDYRVNYNEKYAYLELVKLPEDVKTVTYSAYLALNENIDICLKMKNLGTDFSKDELSVTVDGNAIESTKITVKNGTASCVLVEVAPQDIDTVFNVVVTYDDVVVKSFSYSAVKYCNSVFAKYTSGELHDLCEALLNYGKWAAAYNGSSVTVSTDHTKVFSDYDFKNVPVASHTSGAASLTIDNIITLNYHVNTEKALTIGDATTQNFYVLNNKGEQIDPYSGPPVKTRK